MKEKNLRLIMELIFIFVMPLLFILPCVKIKDNYVYDNEGNYQVSEKVVEFESPLNLTIQVIETRSSISTIDTHYVSVDDIQYEDWIWLGDIQFGDNDIAPEDYDLEDLELLYNITGSLPFSPEDYGGNNYIFVDNANWVVFACTYEWFENEFIFGPYNSLEDITGFYVLDFTYDTYQVITEEEDLNLFGKFKLLIMNVLHVESSVILDLVLTYTFLWLLMFIIWHLLYTILDFIVHLVKIRKRE